MVWSWRARPGPVPGHGGGDGVGQRSAGRPERRLVFTGVQHEGLVELVILNAGMDLGILSPPLFTMMVIMALVTTFMTTPILIAMKIRPQQSYTGP